MNRFIKLIASIIIFLTLSTVAHAQFVDGTKGLLCMPSAEMEEDATFMITNNLLHKEYLPRTFWDYNTFGYGFSVSLWGRLEIAYVCTIFDGKRSQQMKDPYWKIMFNQDRHFAARVAVTKDGEWGQKWLPAIAIGVSDPVTGAGGGQYVGSDVSSGNGSFNRMYVAVSKNFQTAWGDVGGHVAYQYSFRKDGMPTGPQAAVTWNPVWLNREGSFLSSFRTTLEWDARYVNLGINASIWKNRFEFMAMLLNMRYPMVGARFKLHLSH